MKLAILTQYYPPEIGAPQVRLSELARLLVQRGHDVTVLTALPNYPTGRIYPGYGRGIRREVLDGVRVIRAPIYPTQAVDFGRRMLSYGSFAFAAGLVGAAALRAPDYLLVESPPLLLGLTGAWLAGLKRARMIFNVSDLWPDSAVRLGALRVNGAAHRLAVRLERFCYRRAWLVTGQSREIVADIAARFSECRTFHLSNGVDTRRFRPDLRTDASRALLGPGDRCVALYAGLHGLAQGLDQVLDAARELRGEAGLEIALAGDGPEKAALVRRAECETLSGVRFIAPRPHAQMPALLAAADIALVPLKEHLPGAVPSKLYEAMASGRPVVLVAEGEPAAIVREQEAGIVVRPGDTPALVDALRTLNRDPALRARLGANGRRAAEQHYDRFRISSRFIDFLETQLAPGGDGRGDESPTSRDVTDAGQTVAGVR